MWSACRDHPSARGDLAGCGRRHDQAAELFAEGMVAVKTYRVAARRWARGWELHIEGVGVTQCRTLGEAESMVRDYIAADLDVDPDSFQIHLTVSLGDDLDSLLGEARDASREAIEAQNHAAETSRMLARRLSEAGLSGREVAMVLDVSPQRVSQLLAAMTKDSARAARSMRSASDETPARARHKSGRGNDPKSEAAAAMAG